MQGLTCVLACLLAFPVFAQQAAPAPAKTQADARKPAKTEAELPLPATPIPVPVLAPNAGKAELVRAYYDITGGRMLDALMQQLTQPSPIMQARVANCPAAKQAQETHYRDVVQPHFRAWLDNSLRPRILAALNQGLAEAELRAFLRFAATPNGQRHLNQIALGRGKRNGISQFPEFLQDAHLRAYARQLDAMGDRVDEVMNGTHAELMAPAFMDTAHKFGEQLADLVLACQQAVKP